MLKRTCAVAGLLAIAGGALRAQQGTDFSGTWVLIDSSDRAASVPQTLVVQQPLTATTVFGQPMTPYYRYLTVERRFGDRVQRDSYEIGVIGGYVAGAPDGARSEWSARWQDAALRLDYRDINGPREVIRASTETWSITPQRRLVIRIDTWEHDTVATRTLTFRQEPPPTRQP